MTGWSGNMVEVEEGTAFLLFGGGMLATRWGSRLGEDAGLQLDSVDSSEDDARCGLLGQISMTREKSCGPAVAGW